MSGLPIWVPFCRKTTLLTEPLSLAVALMVMFAPAAKLALLAGEVMLTVGGGLPVPQVPMFVQGWPLPAGPLLVAGLCPWVHQFAR